ncbi:MAG: hypothetical protein JWP89_6702 [Schlesneria sp.]|nr:hypothetical protein [Schlesneria sp.]
MSLTVLRVTTALVCVCGSLICWFLFGSFAAGIGVFGSLLSVVSLIVTIDVLVAVRQIQRRYVRQAVLKVGVDKLNSYRRNLATAIRERDPDNSRRVLSQVRGTLSRLVIHFGKELPIEECIRTIEVVLAMDNRQIVSRSRDAQSHLESTAEGFALLLMEHEWGEHDG